MASDTFRAGDLTAVIGDNEPYEGHRAGYNGVHCLTIAPTRARFSSDAAP